MALLDFVKLEKLPYLSAWIREGIPLSYGTTSRMPQRLAIQRLDYLARTPTSMTIADVNHDEEVLPEPAQVHSG